jgi:hypothetical protein
MRVFDYVGVKEAVGEISDGIEKKKSVEPAPNTEESTKPPPVAEAVRDEPPIEKTPTKRTYVADSEDEEDDEEMLFDFDVTANTAVQPVQEPDPMKIEAPETTQAEAGHIKILLIDNLAQVLNPLLKKDLIQGILRPFLTTNQKQHTDSSKQML